MKTTMTFWKTQLLTLFCAAIPLAAPCSSEILAEGKTKIVRSYPDDPHLAIFESKDVITAFNTKREAFVGKAAFATQTTCNVFRLLSDCKIPVAFRKQLDTHRFLGDLCQMIPYEVVVRREAHGSYLKRNPQLEKGTVFPKLVLEFFLKTSDNNWQGTPIPKDDPFVQFTESGVELYLPDVPIPNQKPFLVLSDYPLKGQPEHFEQIAKIAKQTFLVLEKAWQMENARLVDFKVEFGFNHKGDLLLADVIDNDSWRVVQNQQYIDKQAYRDGQSIDAVTQLYQRVSFLTDHFKLPNQQLILWRGSDKDDLEPFLQQFKRFESPYLKSTIITSSAHKNPIGSYLTFQDNVKQVSDSVLISYIGRSNGAEPTLAANATIPVITTPAGGDQFHEDVWSSLKEPSATPVMTVMEPQNAVLAAMQILACRNPLLYMQLRMEQEERLTNVVEFGE